ncbi:MAG: TonB-dependent receptor plug domain-containing protein [Leeuwenhoekiella sp.]
MYIYRGTAKHNLDEAPLILIDGEEKDRLEQVNPDMIESLTVLKDSSATKRFGSKAKNGVILITTKKEE